MLKNIHVHLKKRIFTKNLVHIHMENTDSGKPVQFQNRLVSLRSLEKWSRVWQFSNHLSLRQNTQFWKAGVPEEYLFLHRLIGYHHHLLCLITCVILNITASHPPPKDKVQNMKLRVSDFMVASNSVLLFKLRSKSDWRDGSLFHKEGVVAHPWVVRNDCLEFSFLVVVVTLLSQSILLWLTQFTPIHPISQGMMNKTHPFQMQNLCHPITTSCKYYTSNTNTIT